MEVGVKESYIKIGWSSRQQIGEEKQAKRADAREVIGKRKH